MLTGCIHAHVTTAFCGHGLMEEWVAGLRVVRGCCWRMGRYAGLRGPSSFTLLRAQIKINTQRPCAKLKINNTPTDLRELKNNSSFLACAMVRHAYGI